MNFTYNGIMDPPTGLWLENDSVQQGETLVLHFDEGGEDYWLNVDYFRRDTNEYLGHTVTSRRGASSVTLSAGWLEPGEYTLNVNADTVGKRFSEFEYIDFTVTGNTQDVIFRSDRQDVMFGENFSLFFYAPGAERVRLAHAWEDNYWQEEEGDSLDSYTFGVGIDDENGNNIDGRQEDLMGNPGYMSFLIDAECYEVDKTYSWNLWVNGEGYNGNGISGEFTVTDSVANVFSLESQDVPSGRDINFLMRRANAEKLRLRIKVGSSNKYYPEANGVEGAEWQDSYATWELEPGAYSVTAQYYLDNAWKNLKTLTVNIVNYGDLEAPDVIIPTVLFEGSDLVVTGLLNHLPEFAWYHVNVESTETGEMVAHVDSNDIGRQNFYTFPNELFEVDKTYRVSVNLYAFGYNGDGAWGDVEVREAQMDAPTFILPSGLTAIEEEAFMGFAAEVVQVPASVRSIGSLAFAYNTNLRQIYIPATVTSIADNAFEGDYVMIFGQGGSYANEYAENHGIVFVPIN